MRSRITLALAAAIAYSSALASGFVWDDHHTLERGRLIGSLGNLPALFSHDTMFNADGGRFAAAARVDTYRPLTMATFFVERALFGLRAWAFHLDSILLHVAVVLLLFAVGRRLVDETAAWWGALIFAVHPGVSEAVHWVNGRSDPLCVLFFLTALWAWLDGRAWAVAVAVLAATLSKETAFALLPPLVFLGRRGPAWPWLAGAAAGLACRMLALGKPAVAAGGAHLWYALTRLPLVWLDGVVSLLVPIGRAPPSLYERYQHPSVAWWAAAIAVSAALGALVLWRRGLVGWAIASFLGVLAPVSLLTYDEGWFGWGRYLYPSLPAIALVAGTLVEKKRLARIGAAIVATAMGASTFLAGRDWRDDRSFARAMAEDHPEASMGWSELAVVELREGQPAEALADAERAIERAPRNYRHWSRAASALMRLDRRPEAYQAAARALQLEPDDANAHYVTAIRLLGERREAEAASHLLEALRLEPEQDGPWATLEQARAHLSADSDFARALSAASRDPRYAGIAARLR
jgi:protein O-mannosyl-transferase